MKSFLIICNPSFATWLPTIFGAQMSTWHGGTPQTRFCLTLPSQTNWARIPAVKNGKANQFSRMLGIMQSKKCCRCEHNALQRTTHLLLFVFCVFVFLWVFFGRVIRDISSRLFRKPFFSLVIYTSLLSTAPVEREVSRVTLDLVACAVTPGLPNSAVVFRLCGIVRGL